MGDRIVGMIKCPYCEKETEFLYNSEWGLEQWCDNCNKKFIIEMKLVAMKLKDEDKKKKINKEDVRFKGVCNPCHDN